jgi:ABC-2 type transport system permease protein
MSAVAPRAKARGTEQHRTGIGTVYRVEIAKITSQLLPRAAVLVCLVGPFAFALFINTQTSVPADVLFGRWVHASGFAIPFVVLGFGGIVGFPLLTSLVAGDIFAGEDGHATWKTVLTRSCSRLDIFAAKCLAAATFSIAMVALLAVTSTVAGVVIVGTQPLISLSGEALAPGRAIILIVESFGIALLPTLAFTCVGILFSVASRKSIVGVLGPPVVGLIMLVVSLMGSGALVRSMLLTTPFEAWHGLLVAPPRSEPLVLGALVCAAYSYLCLDAARRSFRGRDFAGEARSVVAWSRLARWAVVGLIFAGLLSVGTALDRTWISSPRLGSSFAATFKNLAVLQESVRGQSKVRSNFNVYSSCRRESVVSGPSRGAGDDWTCRLFVDIPALRDLPFEYTMTVRANGCYTAEAPPSVIGPLNLRRAQGGVARNPLYAFDGCMIPP